MIKDNTSNDNDVVHNAGLIRKLLNESKIEESVEALINRIGIDRRRLEHHAKGDTKNVSMLDLLRLMREIRYRRTKWGSNISVYDLFKEEHHDLLRAAGAGCNAEIKSFENDETYTEYLQELENDGRMVILSKFPSCVYEKEPHSDIERRRMETIRGNSAQNFEIYPISSLIEFGFSPTTRFSREEKLRIIERVDSVFAASKGNKLFFFCDNRLNGHVHYEIEVAHKKDLVVLTVPSHKTTVVEIEEPRIARYIYDYVDSDMDTEIWALHSEKVLTHLKSCIHDGEEIENLIEFYKSCKSHNTETGEYIKQHVSPWIRDRMSKSDENA